MTAADFQIEALRLLASAARWRKSPEWLENPSVRVELRAAADLINAARAAAREENGRAA